MRKWRAEEIINAWDLFEEMDPDISTEQLFARIEADQGCDAGDICEAMKLTGRAEEA